MNTRHLRSLMVAPFVLGGMATLAPALTSTSVENLTSVSSVTVQSGLGFNMTNVNNTWEFQMAHAAGATEARFQPSWSAVQSMSGTFTMPANMEAALADCTTYGLHPLLTAAYGSPYQSLGNFTVAQAYPINTTVIKLNESVAGITVPNCQVMGASNTQIVDQDYWSYAGALISAVDTTANTITLVHYTNVPLSAGQTLVINHLLYPSCATASPTDPSIMAYANYVAFLGGRITAHALTGRVELWNEPPWAHDPWDHRGGYYTAGTVPPGITTASPNFGIAENLAPTTASAGVHYNWGGTHKSGGRSVLYSGYMSPALTATEVAHSIACESYHPYGNSPEDLMWDPTILAALPSTSNVWTAILPGASQGSNFVQGRKMNLLAPSLNFKQNITETGTETSDNVRKARFILRQYLGFLADGLERVTFYSFAAPGAATNSTFGFVDQTTQAATQAYTAIQGLVATDMAEIHVAPLSYTVSDLPTVPSYNGTYPLTTLSIVGREAATDTKNIIYYVTWQRSHVAPGLATNLAVTSATGHVSLSWQPNYYAVTTAIERATASGGPYTPLVSNLHFSQTTYTDSTTVNGTTYYYIAVGTNPGGTSGNSIEVSATPTATGPGTFNNNTHAGGAAQGSWLALTSPPPANVTTQLPTGYTATRAWDLVTRATVPVTLSGTTATYAVSDDPVCLAVAPAPINYLTADFQDGTNPFTIQTPANGGSMSVLSNAPTSGNKAIQFEDNSTAGNQTSSFVWTLPSTHPLVQRINQVLAGTTPTMFTFDFDVQRTVNSSKPVFGNMEAYLESPANDGNPPAGGRGRDRFWTGQPSFGNRAAYQNGTYFMVDNTIFPEGNVAAYPWRGFQFEITPDGTGKQITTLNVTFTVRADTAGTPEAYLIDNIHVYEIPH